MSLSVSSATPSVGIFCSDTNGCEQQPGRKHSMCFGWEPQPSPNGSLNTRLIDPPASPPSPSSVLLFLPPPPPPPSPFLHPLSSSSSFSSSFPFSSTSASSFSPTYSPFLPLLLIVLLLLLQAGSQKLEIDVLELIDCFKLLLKVAVRQTRILRAKSSNSCKLKLKSFTGRGGVPELPD